MIKVSPKKVRIKGYLRTDTLQREPGVVVTREFLDCEVFARDSIKSIFIMSGEFVADRDGTMKPIFLLRYHRYNGNVRNYFVFGDYLGE